MTMNIKTKKININKKPGFLLSEAMVALVITIAIMFTLKGLLQNLKTANSWNMHQDEIAYAYVQFDRFLHANKSDKSYTEQKYSNAKKSCFAIKSGKELKHYAIQQYQSMIRVTTNKGGHMPLLLNVSDAKFETSTDTIKILIIEKDQRKSELVFKLKEEKTINEKESKG